MRPEAADGLIPAVTAPAIHNTIHAVWKIEPARLIAGLARMVRDVGLAEDLAQDALVAALESGRQRACPDNPGAWLMATAKHRALDRLRRRQMLRAQARGARARARAIEQFTCPTTRRRSTTTSATTCCG